MSTPKLFDAQNSILDELSRAATIAWVLMGSVHRTRPDLLPASNKLPEAFVYLPESSPAISGRQVETTASLMVSVVLRDRIPKSGELDTYCREQQQKLRDLVFEACEFAGHPVFWMGDIYDTEEYLATNNALVKSTFLAGVRLKFTPLVRL
jgi:hypothetical protein